MFVSTIDSCTSITVLASDLWMYIEALVTVGTFWEELALLCWVMVLTLSCSEVAFWPMLASDLAFLSLCGRL